MRERLCRHCGKWHPLDAWPAACRVMIVARSSLSTPMVLTDTMNPVRSQLDGKMYDSKAALRRTYKEGGVVELGNEAPLTRPVHPPPDAEEIRDVVAQSMAAAEKLDNVHETAAMAETLD